MSNVADLPHGWVNARLDQIFGTITDGDHQPPPQSADGVPFVVIGDTRDGAIDFSGVRFVPPSYYESLAAQKKPERGDLLYTVTGSFGIPLRVSTDERFCVQRHIAILKPTVSTNVRYVALALSTTAALQQAAKLATGTAQKTVGLASLRSMTIPLAPTEEQQRISDALESLMSRLDAAVASLERAQSRLKAYRASVLKAAVEGRLVPTEAERAAKEGRSYEPADLLLARILTERRRRWEEAELARMNAAGKMPNDDKWKAKYQEPASVRADNLPRLPVGWCWTTLDTFLEGIDAGKNFSCEERPPGHGEVGVVKVSAVTWGTFDENETKTCTRKELVNLNYLIKQGDFLFSRANTLELVGACVIVAEFKRTLLLSDKILRLRFIGGAERWLMWVLRSYWGRREIEALASGNQLSMRNLSQANLRRLRIPVPPSVEVERIVDHIELLLSVADETNSVLANAQRRSNRLRQAVLRFAFEGKLVDQDPADEPADVLLARIRAERSIAASSQKKTRARKLKAAS